MLIPAMAKLLLQSDTSPVPVVEDVAAQFLLAAQEERVKCCLRPAGWVHSRELWAIGASCASGGSLPSPLPCARRDALAVAVGQRLVTVRWRDPACAPDLADLGFVSAAEPPEEVTAVVWPSPGAQPAGEPLCWVVWMSPKPLASVLCGILGWHTQCRSVTPSADECILVGTSEGWVQLHAPDGRLLHRQELHGTAVLALHVRWECFVRTGSVPKQCYRQGDENGCSGSAP